MASKQEDTERQEAAIAYQRFLEEAQREPIKFVKHDARAHDDEALYRLVSKLGMEWYGWYWLLVELLTAHKDHSYDVSDDLGWRRLARDLSCMVDMDVEDCRAFIGELAKLELISSAHLEELHVVTIARIRRDAYTYAEGVASKKLGAWKTNRKRMFG